MFNKKAFTSQLIIPKENNLALSTLLLHCYKRPCWIYQCNINTIIVIPRPTKQNSTQPKHWYFPLPLCTISYIFWCHEIVHIRNITIQIYKHNDTSPFLTPFCYCFENGQSAAKGFLLTHIHKRIKCRKA